MKKLCLLATFSALIFALPFYSYSIEPEPKEYISVEMPKEVKELLEKIEWAEYEQDPRYFSSGETPGANDYDIRYFVSSSGGIVAVFKIWFIKDNKGNITPGGSYDGVLVAVVFKDKKVSWFKDLATKKIFEEATR